MLFHLIQYSSSDVGYSVIEYNLLDFVNFTKLIILFFNVALYTVPQYSVLQ